MSDIRTLKIPSESLLEGNMMTSLLSVTAGMPVLEALQISSCHFGVVVDVLTETATNSTECSSQLYAILAVAEIAKGLLDSAVSAIEVDGREVHHG
ncbi:DUF3077 domain-containing protein [Burkholderia pseudomallei]|uniref:DUF3077 domain-containing protein n=1 Tax=Burkholderia pseudomallei TaxID=28450 RepID=UPI00100A7F60|nr:DUF3077 domain-containing protein [Burkholderia pseudomallei]